MSGGWAARELSSAAGGSGPRLDADELLSLYRMLTMSRGMCNGVGVTLFESVVATAGERSAPMAGDELIPRPDAVMDRAFTLPAGPEAVWPWLVQLGKRRAGWYLPSSVERFIPTSRRALRSIDRRWQQLAAGDVIPDYGGRDETFEVVLIDPPHRLVYRSQRGRMNVTWSMSLEQSVPDMPGATRVHLRLRLGPVRRRWLVRTAGELIDLLTIAGVAAGLRERLPKPAGAL